MYQYHKPIFIPFGNVCKSLNDLHKAAVRESHCVCSCVLPRVCVQEFVLVCMHQSGVNEHGDRGI